MPPQAIDKYNIGRVLAWARYVFWADVERQQYDEYEPSADEPTTGLSFVLMAQWYAALWVSIEGWRSCPLSDSTVDELLNDAAFEPNLHLLRRFRNGVFHYQDALIDERLGGFFRESSKTIPWAFLVHSEFKRVIWEFIHSYSSNSVPVEGLIEDMRQIIGWLPNEIPEAAPFNAYRRYLEIANMILADGSRETPEAKNLLSLAKDFRSTADQSAADWSNYKRSMIVSLKRANKV